MLRSSDEKDKSIIRKWQERDWGENFWRENEQFQRNIIGESDGVVEVECEKFGKGWDQDWGFCEQLQAIFLIDWLNVYFFKPFFLQNLL